MPDADIIDRIELAFRRFGGRSYEGARRESVSALEHALQCARLAGDARAAPALVAAAFLHDIGHFLSADSADPAAADDVDDRHEQQGALVLRAHFPAAVTEPVRLHVAAKRYLTAVEPSYPAGLSPASVHSLARQGGPMSAAEIAGFEALPHADDAVRLRLWDDQAKVPGRATPTLDHCLGMLGRLRTARPPA